MLPGVAAAVARFAPDVVVADQQALAGALAARQAGVTGRPRRPPPRNCCARWRPCPRSSGGCDEQIAGFQRAHGVTDPADLRFSDQLVLVFTTSALIGDVSGFPGHYAFTGPALTARPDRGSFPWEWLDPGRALRAGLAGHPERPGRAAVLRHGAGRRGRPGRGASGDHRRPGPGAGRAPHVLLAGHVPQLALLPHLSAVVSHGGHNTVCETLAHGLPLVVAPIRDDQPIIAQQVADAGAGVRVRFGRITGGRVRRRAPRCARRPRLRGRGPADRRLLRRGRRRRDRR